MELIDAYADAQMRESPPGPTPSPVPQETYEPLDPGDSGVDSQADYRGVSPSPEPSSLSNMRSDTGITIPTEEDYYSDPPGSDQFDVNSTVTNDDYPEDGDKTNQGECYENLNQNGIQNEEHETVGGKEEYYDNPNSTHDERRDYPEDLEVKQEEIGRGLTNEDLEHPIITEKRDGLVDRNVVDSREATNGRVRFVDDVKRPNEDGHKGKRSAKAKPPPKIKNKHVGEDPTKLIAEISPGKKGGEFSLPFGGNITVPGGTFGKKDVVTCCMVSPSDRYKYQPPLTSNDHLLSEIFILATSLKSVKKPIILKLPYNRENLEVFDVHFQWKKQDDSCWQKKDCSYGPGRFVEFETHHGGIFVMTSCPKTETFTIPINGCLYSTKICKQISVRIPKKASDEDMPCDIQIIPLNRDNLPNLRRDHPNEMGDIVEASDFYDIRPAIPRSFRRAVTVKLPLPPLETEEFPQEDIVIMLWTSDGWQWHEVNLKFTKNSCSFDTKVLGKFCVVLCKHERQKRLSQAFKRLEAENEVQRGEIIPFVHLQEKLWTLWFDCVPNENVNKITELRKSQGFRPCQVSTTNEDEEDEKTSFRSKSWRSRRKEPAKPQERTDVDLINGREFQLDIGGDVKINEEELGGPAHPNIQYHDRLSENYRKFYLEPRGLAENERDEGKQITGTLRVYRADPTAEKGKVCLKTYSFEVEADHVKDYYYEEPEPEPEPQPEPEPEPEIQVKQEPQNIVVGPRAPNASFLRLTALHKPPKKLVKESKVLTGKSLMVLAREIEQGLTLAIHLDISDSTITGMGFDALANGLGLVDITYRILLLWKRRSSKMKEQQVDILASALDDMGRPDLASVVLDRHRQNQELSFGCFDLDPDRM